MASTTRRRPLPALIALLALLALTALVWWRVSNRDDGTSATAKACPSPSTSASAAAPHTLPLRTSVDVLVLNSTTRNGIAGKARKTLMADGFRSTLPASDDSSKNKVTGLAQIRYSADNRSGALLLQYYFPGAQLVQLGTASAQVTVSLGPTYKAVQPQQAVTARLAANKITLTTAPPTPTPSTSSSC